MLREGAFNLSTGMVSPSIQGLVEYTNFERTGDVTASNSGNPNIRARRVVAGATNILRHALRRALHGDSNSLKKVHFDIDIYTGSNCFEEPQL